MRIIAGQYRGTRLAALGKGDNAAHLRPTPDRVRESLFSVLTSWVDWEGLRVLDLFAGTGALGLEALSRGAAHATFVDNGRTGQRLISENIGKLRCAESTSLLRADAARIPVATQPVGLVFLDPPYGKGLGAPAIAHSAQNGWIDAQTLIVWEDNAPQTAADGFDVLDRRRYGDTHISLLQKAE